MKDFVERRTAWIDTQFPTGPTISPAGGSFNESVTVSLDVPNGSEGFYTIDGSDPRQTTTVGAESKLLTAGSTAHVLVPTNNNLINECDELLLEELHLFHRIVLAKPLFQRPQVLQKLAVEEVARRLSLHHPEAMLHGVLVVHDDGSHQAGEDTPAAIHLNGGLFDSLGSGLAGKNASARHLLSNPDRVAALSDPRVPNRKRHAPPLNAFMCSRARWR